MGNKGELLLSQYTGSKSLSFVCTLTSLSIDQVNFIACQFVALFLSFGLRRWVKDPFQRLLYCLLCGFFICYFCFGIQIIHVIFSAGMCYVVIRNNKSKSMPWLVLTLSMAYLSYLHLKRQFFETAVYSLDITGPLMVLTQKVTSLAFAIGDGKNLKEEDHKGTELQKKHAISETPNMLEYWSYIFQFQSMLAGPLVFYGDYHEFIYGDVSPNPFIVVVRKLFVSIFFAVLYMKAAPQFEIDILKDPEFLGNTSVFYKMLYITIATTLERCKYYHAWILSDAVCNASGLGYNKSNKSWDLVTNVEAVSFEFGLNLKESLDLWNKGTMKWLRYVVYERFNSNIRTWVTYGASAIWHGFYPGYYLTFLSGALFTSAARVIRKSIRPFLIQNLMIKRVYDVLTWFTTRLVVSYCSFTFVLLDLMPSLIVYARIYFFLHIAAVSAMVVLPTVSKRVSKMQFQSKNMIVRKPKDEIKLKNNSNGMLSSNGLRLIPGSGDEKSLLIENSFEPSTTLNGTTAKLKTDSE